MHLKKKKNKLIVVSICVSVVQRPQDRDEKNSQNHGELVIDCQSQMKNRDKIQSPFSDVIVMKKSLYSKACHI